VRWVKRAIHARIDDDAAGGIAATGEVGVAVPDLGRIEILPCRADQRVLRQGLRQPGAAGIPEALLGPIAPGGERTGAGERGAAQQEVASFQECVG